MLGICTDCGELVTIRAMRRFEGGELDYAPIWHPVPEVSCFGSGGRMLITDHGMGCCVCDERWEMPELSPGVDPTNVEYCTPDHPPRLDGAPSRRREQCLGTGRAIR